MLGQVTILEAAAGEHDPRFAGLPRDLDDDFHEGVVKLRRDDAGRLALPHVAQDFLNCRLPIDQALVNREGIISLNTGLNRKFQLHGGLAFEGNFLPETDEGRDGVEQSARARGDRGVQAALEHLADNAEIGVGEFPERSEIALLESISPQHCVKQADGRAARLFHGHFAAGQAEGTQVRDAFE